MAGEADEGGAAANPAMRPERLLKLLDDQIDRLCREGPQDGALAAARVAAAARSLVLARAAVRKDAAASIAPPEPEGETFDDERLLPPDHPERVAARAIIHRGVERLQKLGGAGTDPAGDAGSGREDDLDLAADVGGTGPDTS